MACAPDDRGAGAGERRGVRHAAAYDHGYDTKRMNMLLAVLEKRVGMKMFQKDVFLNFAGGFKVADPGWTSRPGGGDLLL